MADDPAVVGIAFDPVIRDDARMPMYLVRWPDLSAALVTASDEDELLDILDQVANPEGCSWSLYEGPVFIEFQLNAEFEVEPAGEGADRPLQPSDLHIGDVSRICARDPLTAVIPMADTAHEMLEAITEVAFPALHAALNASDEEDLSEAEVRAALSTELERLIHASWQQNQTKRRPDAISQVAAAMRTSPRVVEYVRRAVDAAEASPKPERPVGGNKPPGRGPKRPQGE